MFIIILYANKIASNCQSVTNNHIITWKVDHDAVRWCVFSIQQRLCLSIVVDHLHYCPTGAIDESGTNVDVLYESDVGSFCDTQCVWCVVE